MTTRADITTALRLLRALRDDVEEDMGAEIDELCGAWATGPRDVLAAEDMADSIATLCREYGYPSPLGEPLRELCVVAGGAP